MGGMGGVGAWEDVGWEDLPHVPQWVFKKGNWVDMAVTAGRRENANFFRPSSRYFWGFWKNPEGFGFRQSRVWDSKTVVVLMVFAVTFGKGFVGTFTTMMGRFLIIGFFGIIL